MSYSTATAIQFVAVECVQTQTKRFEFLVDYIVDELMELMTFSSLSC